MKSPCKPVIGLAGGVGSGKSTVAGMLRDLGCVVANSDEHARAALRDPAIRDAIITWWGSEVTDRASGEIDRSAVARIVFADAGERRRLESLTHPWIEARRLEQFNAAPPEAPAMVIDAPLLFESGLDKACDAVVFVDAPEAIRRQRVLDHRGWADTELTRREAAQWPLEVKKSRADHVILNHGDLDELQGKVARTLEAIIAARAGG